MIKGYILPLLALFPAMIGAWDHPRTKDRMAFILEAGPGVLFKESKSTDSALYHTNSQGELTSSVINTKPSNWQLGAGMRASAQVLANNREGAEFLYTGLFNWTAHKSASNSVGVLTSPYSTTDWKGASKITWSMSTSYNSYEILMWFYVTPRFENYFSFAVNVGGRFINIVDTDLFYSFYTSTSSPSEMKATTNNWLRGGEVGFEVNVRPLSYLSWGAILKGGAFADAINRKIYLTDWRNSVVVANTDNDEKTIASFLGEALPYLNFQSQCVFAKLVGDFVYIADISTTASSLIKTRKISQINTTTKIILAGAFLELGYVF